MYWLLIVHKYQVHSDTWAVGLFLRTCFPACSLKQSSFHIFEVCTAAAAQAYVLQQAQQLINSAGAVLC
jgi:hypothetical protein